MKYNRFHQRQVYGHAGVTHNDIARGWCRLMGLAPLTLFTVTLLVVRNQRILVAWNARQDEDQRRAAKGLPPKTRRRRRKTLTALTTGLNLAAPGTPPVTRTGHATTPQRHHARLPADTRAKQPSDHAKHAKTLPA
jgi:hypothetical protein